MSKVAAFAERMGLIKEVEPNSQDYSENVEMSETDSKGNDYSPPENHEHGDGSVNRDKLEDEVRKLIAKLYAIDTSPNVFKIQEILDGLPKELTTDSKRSTVINILQSFNLDPDDLFEDGLEKLRLLADNEDNEQRVAEDAISEANEKAEELRKELSMQERIIANNQAYQTVVATEFMKETKRVHRLLEFISPARYNLLLKEEYNDKSN